MLFPEVERVIYQKNPLEEVICQFRYPKILRIRQETPVEFQEAIRSKYPLFAQKSGAGVNISQEIAQLLPPELVNVFQQPEKAYEFTSRDRNWTVSLTPDFLALTNKNYIKWEDFHVRLVELYDALINIYGVSFFIRIGLRYQNVIRRSNMHLGDVQWSQLVNPTLASFLATDKEGAVEDTSQITLLRLDDGLGKVRIRHGLVKHKESEEICYVIDSDFFTDSEEDVENGLSTVTEFKRRNTNLFRWCISNRLHEAMEPTSF